MKKTRTMPAVIKHKPSVTPEELKLALMKTAQSFCVDAHSQRIHTHAGMQKKQTCIWKENMEEIKQKIRQCKLSLLSYKFDKETWLPSYHQLGILNRNTVNLQQPLLNNHCFIWIEPTSSADFFLYFLKPTKNLVSQLIWLDPVSSLLRPWRPCKA